MPKFSEKLEIQDSTTSRTTIALDGDKATISAGDNNTNGSIIFYDIDGKERMKIGAEDYLITGKNALGVNVLEVFDTMTMGASIWIGVSKDDGGKKAGSVVVRDNVGNPSITLDGSSGSVILQDQSGKRVLFLESNADGGVNSGLFLGVDGKPGKLILRNGDGSNSIDLDGSEGDMMLFDKEGHRGFALLSKAPSLLGNPASMWIGANKKEGPKAGHVSIRNSSGYEALVLDGAKGNISIADTNGHPSFVMESTDRFGSDYNRLVVGVSRAGDLRVCNKTGKHSIVLDGYREQLRLQDPFGAPLTTLDGTNGDINLTTGNIQLDEGNISLRGGDIFLRNADCAEDFDFSGSNEVESGTVVVIESEGKLITSTTAYDKRVAGVISGAGCYKSGIVLDKKGSNTNRKPLALMGKVYCKVDADFSPVQVGDLLTSSSTAGHAMKAIDPFKAFGAVIGKALSSLSKGQGLIPILVTLQ